MRRAIAENLAGQRRILPPLTLQWHITEKCNFRCTHCYQEGYTSRELAFKDLLFVLEQFKTLLVRFKRENPLNKTRGHINISGGEPFLRNDFLSLLEVFKRDKAYYSYGILTNGSFIDADMARKLKALGASYAQVSLEGSEETNDAVRGKGAHAKTVSALKHLTRISMPAAISFTAHRANYMEFMDVARLGRRLGVWRVWADRLIPYGSGANLTDQLLTSDETRQFFEVMFKARSEVLSRFCRTEISLNRALQFLVGGEIPYQCAAGDTLITIQPNGDLYPCRRMPVRVGNLFETDLTELYYSSNFFQALRNRNAVRIGCENCRFNKSCQGGLKCLSYAISGTPFKADPGCWLAAHEETNPNGKGDFLKKTSRCPT
jgi:radical SAM protein with 4Fe4S-binding SPASM domain